jgi:hypothetical protein
MVVTVLLSQQRRVGMRRDRFNLPSQQLLPRGLQPSSVIGGVVGGFVEFGAHAADIFTEIGRALK